MTGRHSGYVVTLKHDIREDDAEEGVLNAIRMIKGVTSVKPIFHSLELDLATEKARRELLDKIWDVLTK